MTENLLQKKNATPAGRPGRKKADYETVVIRVPKPLEKSVRDLIESWHDERQLARLRAERRAIMGCKTIIDRPGARIKIDGDDRAWLVDVIRHAQNLTQTKLNAGEIHECLLTWFDASETPALEDMPKWINKTLPQLIRIADTVGETI